MPSKPIVPMVCAYCGAEFLARADKVKAGRRCCSRLCGIRQHRIEHPQDGPNNAHWKGGVAKHAYRYKKLAVAKRPDAIKAHKAVHDAVRAGRLTRGRCEVCGTTEHVAAHHDDYSKPLEVRWLCNKHHRMHHGASC